MKGHSLNFTRKKERMNKMNLLSGVIFLLMYRVSLSRNTCTCYPSYLLSFLSIPPTHNKQKILYKNFYSHPSREEESSSSVLGPFLHSALLTLENNLLLKAKNFSSNVPDDKLTNTNPTRTRKDPK